MCRQVVIFGAEYFKWWFSHDLETLISELLLKKAFRKYIHPPPPTFVVSELQFIEVKYVAKQWNFEI